MMRRYALLAVSIGLAGCGGSDGTLFAGRGGGGRPDAATSGDSSMGSGGASSSSGGSGASGASGTAGNSGGGSGASGASGSGGRGGPADGSVGGSGAANDAAVDAPTNGSDATTDASGSGGKGGAAGAGGTTSSGGASSGGKGGAGDGGAPVGVATPMAVSCGTTSCTITTGITNICCALPLSFPPFPTGCFPIFPGCVTTGAPFTCDDAADCSTAGNICCGATTGTSCAKTCTTGRVQFCRTNGECKSGTCRPWSTAKEYSTCQ